MFFSSSTILSIKFSCKFNRNVLCLYLLVCAFVGWGLSNTIGSSVGSGVDSGVECFSGNILLLKLFRTFSLALKRNPTFFEERHFLTYQESNHSFGMVF